ncbi:hypothetical protein E3P99_03077 [Wallemia hederae]|uniref:Uncharacterized protein n=1 Tax=Wallemia hederae TaxID=1540922 RepID=A0A4T0FHM7_9BASI|nr:hypothetical protein E3P99_03077 [Wallemia hederae]
MQLKFFAALALVSAVLAQQGAQGGEAGADLLQGLDQTLDVPEGSLKNQTLSEPPAWATSKTETASETQKGARPVETGVPDAAKKQIKQAKQKEAAKDDKKAAGSDSSSPSPSAQPAEAAEAPQPTSSPAGSADDKLLGDGGLLKRQEDEEEDDLAARDTPADAAKKVQGILTKRQAGGAGSGSGSAGNPVSNLLGQLAPGGKRGAGSKRGAGAQRGLDFKRGRVGRAFKRAPLVV